MKICVYGLWHLGSVTSACLASLGHQVIGFDDNKTTVKKIKSGIAPIFETGLDNLIKKGIKTKKLSFTNEYNEIPKDIDFAWIAIDTPVNDEDIADIDHVISKTIKLLRHIESGITVIISSQLPIGSIRKIEELTKSQFPEKEFDFISSPENLRLGNAIKIFLKPDRIIIGHRENYSKKKLKNFFQSISKNLEWMSIESAEMTKHAINSFLANSVVFINELSTICEPLGADARAVERGLKSDYRIGEKAYLSPGSSFSGGTLARDLNYLKEISRSYKLNIPLIDSLLISNDLHKNWIINKIESLFPELSRKTFLIWGLTYKPQTSSIKRSFSIELCQWLINKKAKVIAHDPKAEALPTKMRNSIVRSHDPIKPLAGADVLIIATPWDEYKKISYSFIIKKNPKLKVIDQNGLLRSNNDITNKDYFSVGYQSNK